MRQLTITVFILMSSVSHAKVQNFNDAINEASVSQKILHRRLLRILQGTEESIADNDSATESPQQMQAAANDVKIRLVKVPTKNN